MAYASGLPADLKAALDAASSLRANDLVGEIGWAWSRGASGTAAPTPASSAAASSRPGVPSEEAALAALERSWEESCTSAAGTLALFDELAEQHRSVASLASSLHDRCKELAELEAKTRNVVVKVSHTLSVFDSYYVIASRFGLVAVEDREAAALALHLAEESAADAAAAGAPPPAVAPRGPQLLPGQPEFAAALDRIDECIAHLAAHTGYKEATAFLQRFRALQTAALQGVVRTVQVRGRGGGSGGREEGGRALGRRSHCRRPSQGRRRRRSQRCAPRSPRSRRATGCFPGRRGATGPAGLRFKRAQRSPQRLWCQGLLLPQRQRRAGQSRPSSSRTCTCASAQSSYLRDHCSASSRRARSAARTLTSFR